MTTGSLDDGDKEKRKRDSHGQNLGQKDSQVEQVVSGDPSNPARARNQGIQSQQTASKNQKARAKNNISKNQLLPWATGWGRLSVVDYTREEKAGATLLFRNDWAIIAKGTRGDGTAAWTVAKTEIWI
ncbi:hypothetical protein R1sor_014148 [Riccia sorocarpa]|uniref:Uncharacterized protein n=1 Tax=Riccia sorocarpa TaxID=122646 RepID=A0ABD3HBG3_9MARC